MSIGDVNSREPGSAARYNDGKVPYELMLFKFLPTTSWMPSDFFALMHEYQMSGNIEILKKAYQVFMNLCISWGGDSFMDECVYVWEYGAQKYSQFNWAKGQSWSIPIACISRHYMHGMFADNNPNSNDLETGRPHWAHILCNLQMLLLFSETYPDGNDLPYTFIKQDGS